MNWKVLILLFIIILGVLFLLSYSADDNATSTDLNRTQLNVSGLNSFSVDSFVREINSHEYYVGHNDDTVLWLLSLSGNVVFVSDDYYVVMSKADARRLPVEFATDVEITDTFDCEIIANRSLGKGLGDVLYVRDVKFISKNTDYYDV